jgi:hypothetical protein
MRCWVHAGGKVVGRVQWSTVDGAGTSTTGNAKALLGEVHSFLRRVGRGDQDEKIAKPEAGPEGKQRETP